MYFRRLRLLASDPKRRTALVQFGVTKTLVHMVSGKNSTCNDDVDSIAIQLDCAHALENLTRDCPSREDMVEQGSVPTLIHLSESTSLIVSRFYSFILFYSQPIKNDVDCRNMYRCSRSFINVVVWTEHRHRSCSHWHQQLSRWWSSRTFRDGDIIEY